MSSKSAAASVSLLDELEPTLAHGTVARRVETLRRVTDLFLNGAVGYSSDQIEVFDDVYDCLIQSIERCGKAAKVEQSVGSLLPRMAEELMDLDSEVVL